MKISEAINLVNRRDGYPQVEFNMTFERGYASSLEQIRRSKNYKHKRHEMEK